MIFAILDSDGKVVVNYVYDAWGNHAIVAETGEDVTEGIGALNPFRYRGYYYDTETELYYLQTRYYDPEIGRFISQDSINYADPEKINGLNLYAYCANNPVMNVDPSGESFVAFVIITLVLGLIVGAAAGGISASLNNENIWDGIFKGAAIGFMLGFSIVLVATGVGTPAANYIWGSILAGAGIGSFVTITMNVDAQLKNGGVGSIDLDGAAKAWGLGIGIGAVAGAMSYGGQVVGNYVGSMLGSALSGKSILGVTLSSIISSSTMSELGGILGGLLGSFLFGGFINDIATKEGLIGQKIPLWFGSFIKKIIKI